MTITIKFWGVRGSIASPGPTTAGVGGNTSCVEVRAGDARLVLDAGTGIRALGEQLVREGVGDVALLLSHTHWDHIQGLPFFVPAYLPGTRLAVYGQASGQMVRDVLERQMSSPVFPVRLDELASDLDTRDVGDRESFQIGDVRVTAAKLNHPGGVLAYRIEHGGRSVVYATDTEHYSCVDPALRALADRADVLIYDSQYTPEEYRGEAGPSKVGWGHSTWEEGVRLARVADVGRYVLFHHDPKRTDEGVAELERQAQRRFTASVAAREGMVIELGKEARAA